MKDKFPLTDEIVNELNLIKDVKPTKIDLSASINFDPSELRYTPKVYGEVEYKSMNTIIEENILNLGFGLNHGDALRAEQPINYTNIVNLNGEDVDVSKMSRSEIFKIYLESDNLFELTRTQHVQSLYQSSVPTVKLYYPEPFIASPSFIHQDLGFLHILHYVYWL